MTKVCSTLINEQIEGNLRTHNQVAHSNSTEGTKIQVRVPAERPELVSSTPVQSCSIIPDRSQTSQHEHKHEPRCQSTISGTLLAHDNSFLLCGNGDGDHDSVTSAKQSAFCVIVYLRQ